MWAIREKRFGSQFLFACFGQFGRRETNRIAFRDVSLVVQSLKLTFVYNLWSWNGLYLGEEVSSLLGFLEWVALS